MSASRTLIRKLDLDLIARIEASGLPKKTVKVRSTKPPRAANTYRGARRNNTAREKWPSSATARYRVPPLVAPATNGKREVARRLRQIEAGKLRVSA